MSKMKQSFESYLNSFYSQKGEGHTHTRIGDNALNVKGGVYTVSNLSEFYSKYIKHVFEDGKFEFLTEKQNIDAGPVLVDFDFRYHVSIEEKQHTNDHVNEMVDLYFHEIKTIMDIPDSTSIPVFIFEKENVNMLDEITKDGIHMIIGIHMDRNLQILLRNRMLTRLTEIWSELPLQNSWDEVLDEGITKGTTNWQLYGSRKPGNQQYVLKYYYDLEFHDDELCLNINDVKKFDLKQRFSELTAQYTQHQAFEMSEDIREEYEKIKQSKKITGRISLKS